MTVELAAVKRADMSEQMTVVGNLIGAATVETVPRGRRTARQRLRPARRSRAQRTDAGQGRGLGRLVEQIRQAQASFDVAAATIRQREADLNLAKSNLDRARNLLERHLIPKQTFDDADARYQAAAAQLDLSKAQCSQAAARIDELKINLGNTVIVSPVNGFVGKRMLDPGAWVTPNSSFLSIVDISVVRLVTNVVEKDLRRISTGQRAQVAVDAFPGETFPAASRGSRRSSIRRPAPRKSRSKSRTLRRG